ncbi:TonB-dependent siderophore receptor [Pseudoduganella danionis]|uniref:TonB-dependent siderophore receptor n=1 Tax=Pseudoduganella danionis TaxID=1890295 RepID=A0ABW9SR41_9BURK|nr:TonB-dependent siderophore receptor [Pseudoduganella danionis]MTW34462.1 TonB-dependent siderophore receptor [Pseudoduganella danionis]
MHQLPKLGQLALALSSLFVLTPAVAAASADADYPPGTPVPAEAAESAESAETGSQQVRIHAVRQAYRALSATAASKTDTLLKDLPQSVRVLPADLLADAGVRNLSDALELASGFSRQSNLGGLWDSYAVRGFTGDPNFGSDYLVNGFSSSRGYNGVRDMAGTASVEVLKGPASALYGRGEPGGTVNIRTKKPRFDPAYALDLALGSYAMGRADVDLTGPLSETLAYRFNGAAQQGDNFRDTGASRHGLAAGSLLWLPDADTRVEYELEQARQRTPFDRGVLAINGRLGSVARERFLGEPSDGPVRIDSLGHQLFIEHSLDDDWKLQAGLAYRDSALYGYSTEASSLLADGRTLRRQRRLRDFSATDRSGRVELVGHFATDGFSHAVLLGVDAYRFDDRRVQLRRNPSAAYPYAIDIYQPVYGGKADALALSIDTLEQQRAQAVYLQDQLDLNQRWKALFGLRRDAYTQTVQNCRTASRNQQTLAAYSPRAGLVYQPAPVVSLYASVARGFRPNSGISIDNQAFPAEQSKSYETGAKLESADGRLSATLALYHIAKRNVLTTNPLNTDYALPAGEMASQGVELDVAGELRRGLRLSASYAYTDAQVTRGDQLITTGSRFPNVARHSANLLLSQAGSVLGRPATLGAGLNYVGARPGDVAFSSAFMLPAYATVKLLADWSPSKALKFTLNIDNLLDRQYYASSYSQLWVAPGPARSASLKLHYQF